MSGEVLHGGGLVEAGGGKNARATLKLPISCGRHAPRQVNLAKPLPGSPKPWGLAGIGGCNFPGLGAITLSVAL